MATTRVELPEGAWAELRDPRTLTNGQRKPLTRLLATAPRVDSETLVDKAGKPVKVIDNASILELGETCVRVFVDSWSLSLPVPSVDPSSVDNIPARVFDVLEAACTALIDEAWTVTDVEGTDPTVPVNA